jgi:predicted transcriptional regulator
MTYRQKRDRSKKLIAFEIPVQDLKAVRKLAEEQDRNVSYMLRSAVQQLLAQES